MRTQYTSLALLALPTATLAVSLSDFAPQVDGLTGTCESVYTATISGCQASDFTSGTCSSACIAGLTSYQTTVQEACSGVAPAGESVLNAFLNNEGPSSICPNAPTASSGASDSSTATSTEEGTSTSTSEATSSASEAESSAQSTTSASVTTSSNKDSTTTTVAPSTSTTKAVASTTSSSATTSSKSAKSTSTAIVADTSSAPSKTSTGSSTSTSSASDNSQTNYDDGSGGGSPFDTAGNEVSGASMAEPVGSTVALVMAIVLAMSWL